MEESKTNELDKKGKTFVIGLAIIRILFRLMINSIGNTDNLKVLGVIILICLSIIALIILSFIAPYCLLIIFIYVTKKYDITKIILLIINIISCICFTNALFIFKLDSCCICISGKKIITLMGISNLFTIIIDLINIIYYYYCYYYYYIRIEKELLVCAICLSGGNIIYCLYFFYPICYIYKNIKEDIIQITKDDEEIKEKLENNSEIKEDNSIQLTQMDNIRMKIINNMSENSQSIIEIQGLENSIVSEM